MANIFYVQMLQPYNCARKSLKWYKKLGMHLIQVALLNAFILYKKSQGKLDFLRFIHDVSICNTIYIYVIIVCYNQHFALSACKIPINLIPLYLSQVVGELLFVDVRDVARDENMARLTEAGHYPTKLQPTATWTKPQARCRVCSARGLRRDSTYVCATCPSRPGLCMNVCFGVWHTKLDLTSDL